MGSKQVLTVDLDGEVEEVCVVQGRPSGIGWLPDGRMLVVSMNDRSIVRLDADGTLAEHADLSGLASAPCNRRLSAFDIGDDGTLSNRRTYADLPGRAPDGIALDAEGAVWVADANGNACVRVRAGGEITDVVDTGRGCFACALGGPDRKRLFLLTGERFSGEAMRKRTGAIEMVEVAVPGAGLP